VRYLPTPVEGCRIVEIEPHGDDRGYFARAWCADEQRAQSLEASVAQVNMSLSRRRGTIRGLHRQVEPHGEAKFVRCISGRIFDVCVDLRTGSATYGAWAGVELTPQNRRAFHVPAGCAHGYQALEDDSEVLYLVSRAYVPGAEQGMRWDDPAIGIEWPITDAVIVSDKDGSWPDLVLERPPAG
jgi:dTDP-4-dehydrorhamnose 3,5-epimerase